MRLAVLARNAGLAALMVAVSPSTALAHSPIPGIGTFYGHLLHPIAVLSHLLLLVGVSLFLSQNPLGRPGYGVLAVLIAFIVGLITAAQFSIPPPPEWLILAASLSAGALVSLARPVPTWLTMMFASTAGLLVGIDSTPELLATADRSLAYGGLVAGVALVVVLVTGLLLKASDPRMRIGVRIVGSWILAVSLLVLALAIATINESAMRSP